MSNNNKKDIDWFDILVRLIILTPLVYPVLRDVIQDFFQKDPAPTFEKNDSCSEDDDSQESEE